MSKSVFLHLSPGKKSIEEIKGQQRGRNGISELIFVTLLLIPIGVILAEFVVHVICYEKVLYETENSDGLIGEKNVEVGM